MATTLDTYLPFDSGPGAAVTESGWRAMMKHLNGSASGIVRGFGDDFEVYADSSGMQVKVRTGECLIRGHYGESSSEKTLAIASNSTGSTRIDRVVLRVDFVNNRIELDVKTGTTSAPAVTQNTAVWETSLATVSVANGAATIAAGNVTDQRTFTTVTAKYTYNGSLYNIGSGVIYDVHYNNLVIPSGDVSLNAPLGTSATTLTLGRPGIWTITARGVWAPNTNGVRTLQITDENDVFIDEIAIGVDGSSASTKLSLTTTGYFPMGQQIKMRIHQSSGTSIGVNGHHITVTWMGP